jgi:hypothetical protein
LALPAFAARDSEWNDDAVSNLKFGISATDLNNLAHRLVAHDITMVHAWDKAAVEMEVRAANGAARYSDDRIAVVLNDGVVCLLAANVAASMPGQRFHICSFRVIDGGRE